MDQVLTLQHSHTLNTSIQTDVHDAHTSETWIILIFLMFWCGKETGRRSKNSKKYGRSEAPLLRAPYSFITAGFLSRAGAETPLNIREKFRVFRRTILENFSGVDTQTAVLVSTAEVWISAPDTQTPIFLGFLGIHS